jgi:toxin ParE1/3/4
MSRLLHIRPDALADIEQAADWYDEQQPGVGANFIQAVQKTIRALPVDPLIHRLRDRQRNIRWCYPTRFPYRIIYRVQKKRITILAVLHAARHDREWKKRT